MYRPNEPDSSKAKMQFGEFIRKKAMDPEIYRKFKADRRQTMGDCLMKGEEYELRVKQKRETFLISMKYYVWGKEALTKKEVRLLHTEGIIKQRRKTGGYYQNLSDDNSQDETAIQNSQRKDLL